MATPVPLGDPNPAAITTNEDNDENALPPTGPKDILPSSPKSQMSSSSNPTKTNLVIDTGNIQKNPTLESNEGSNTNSLNFSDSDHFSIDRYSTLDMQEIQSKGGSMDSLCIERSDTEKLERMMAKFDDAQAPTFEEDAETTITDTNQRLKDLAETPKALSEMMGKFDVLKSSSIDEPHQDKMMAKFDLLQQQTIATPKMEDLPERTDSEVYRDKRILQVLSPSNSQDGGFEIRRQSIEEDDSILDSYSTTTSNDEMFAEIEQFRSAESHLSSPRESSPKHKAKAKAASAPSAPASTATKPSLDSNTHRLLEKRIVALMNQVSTLELEKDELRSEKKELKSKNDELQSQLNVQHVQDVQDMYQNPYSDPFGTPSKAKTGAPLSFLESATSNLSAAPSADNSELHRELTELRMQNQTLQSDLETSDRVKERLKKILKTVQTEDKEKQDKITVLIKEMDDGKKRETELRKELDACKIRLEGYEIAHEGKQPSSPNRKSSEGKKSFFGKKSPTHTGDVATALVVSQKQNEALQAHNEELELQNTQLQEKCDALTEKYGLKAPSAGDDKGNQLYSRYLEMKTSLSSLSVVLEEAQEKNSKLNERVTELETELSEQDKQQVNGEDDVASDSSSSSKAITAEQETALKVLVAKLEVQIVDYREAEDRHKALRSELELEVDVLKKEASNLREELEESKSGKTSSDAATPASAARESKLQKEMERCYVELESKIAMETKSIELNSELESLRDAMDAAAVESTKLLSEMETMLATSQEELKKERAKFQELEAKYKVLMKITVAKETGDGDAAKGTAVGELSAELQNQERLLKENEKLNSTISSLQKQTKQLKNELEQNKIKIEKSEKRVSAKHEQAQQLTQANASLRDGIVKLKGHLSTISEEASKTEAKLVNIKTELNTEREKSQQLEIANSMLQTKLDVLKGSIHGQIDEASSKKIELTASLAASQKELLLERGRVQKLSDAKKRLETILENTKDDFQTKLHTQKQRNSELDAEVSALGKELDGTKLVVAAATNKMARIEALKSTETMKLQEVVNSTKAMLSAEKDKIRGLNASKSTLESKLEAMKQTVEGLKTSNALLKVEIDTVKQKSSIDAAESSHQFTELEKLLATTQEELNDEEQQVESLEQQVDALTLKIQELEKCKRDLEVSLDDAKQEIETADAKKAELESLLQENVSVKDGDSTAEKPRPPGKKLGVTKKIQNLLSELENTKAENADLKSSLASLKDGKPPLSHNLSQNEDFIAELETARTALSIERNNTASTDVRLWEAEMLLGNTKRDLKDALKKNEELTGQVDNLESSIEKSQQTNAQTLKECETHVQINKEMAQKIESLEKDIVSLNGEKQSLLKRTAALARRDQIQKASLMTSNDEISKLMTTMSEFQHRFESLAEQVEQGQAEKDIQMKEYEAEEAKWITEKHELNERVNELQAKCDEIQTRKEEMKSEHMKILEDEQSKWQEERFVLNSRIDNMTKTDPIRDSSVVYPLRQCDTDRSLLNQKVCELEQDIQLLEVTMDGTKQQYDDAAVELELAKYKLGVCEEELESCRAEMKAAAEKNATDRETFEEKISKLEEEIESTVVAMEATKKERDSISEQHEETKTKLNLCEDELQKCRDEIVDRVQELKSCQEDLESLKKEKTEELQSATEKRQELQAKYVSCLKELDSCKSELIEKDEVMKELAKKQVQKMDEELKADDGSAKDKRLAEGRNKQALALLADELNEAHIREGTLEQMLTSCQKELSDCQKKLKSFEKQVSEEKSGAGIYKDVISKLNKSNDSLTAKNKQLKEETNSLKKSAAALRTEVQNLKQENEVARVVAGSNRAINRSSSKEVEQENQMMKDLLETSQNSVTEAKNMQQILSNQVEAATKREKKLTKEIVALKTRNREMEKRLEEQEQELDEFESDFALARNDARKVVEQLRGQLSQLEKRNKKLEAASGGLNSIEDLKSKLKQLVVKNKRLEKEIETGKIRERRLESQLGLEPRR